MSTTTPVKKRPRPASSLCILTYNIWFSPAEMDLRMRSIAALVAQHSPHILCFQEITLQHWSILQSQPAIAEYTWAPAPTGDASRSYYTMLGCRRADAMRAPRRTRFASSAMGRGSLSAKFCGICDADAVVLPPLIVATSHLESLDQAPLRQAQLDETFASLELRARESSPPTSDLIFCGDTNIMPSEVPTLAAGWTDAWPLVGLSVSASSARRGGSAASAMTPPRRYDDGQGFTFDVARNGMVRNLVCNTHTYVSLPFACTV